MEKSLWAEAQLTLNSGWHAIPATANWIKVSASAAMWRQQYSVEIGRCRYFSSQMAESSQWATAWFLVRLTTEFPLLGTTQMAALIPALASEEQCFRPPIAIAMLPM